MGLSEIDDKWAGDAARRGKGKFVQHTIPQSRLIHDDCCYYFLSAFACALCVDLITLLSVQRDPSTMLPPQVSGSTSVVL